MITSVLQNNTNNNVGIIIHYLESMKLSTPYSGLFSLGANLPRISRMVSVLRKNYSGLLHEGRLWVTIAEIGTDTIMSRWPITSFKHGL